MQYNSVIVNATLTTTSTMKTALLLMPLQLPGTGRALRYSLQRGSWNGRNCSDTLEVQEKKSRRENKYLQMEIDCNGFVERVLSPERLHYLSISSLNRVIRWKLKLTVLGRIFS